MPVVTWVTIWVCSLAHPDLQSCKWVFFCLSSCAAYFCCLITCEIFRKNIKNTNCKIRETTFTIMITWQSSYWFLSILLMLKGNLNYLLYSLPHFLQNRIDSHPTFVRLKYVENLIFLTGYLNSLKILRTSSKL